MDTLDCGHPESEHGPNTAGYGVDKDGKRHCYACCAERDKAAMVKDGRATLYLTHRGRDCPHAHTNYGCTIGAHWSVSNWPGSLCFPVFPTVKHGAGRGFGYRYQTLHAWFVGPDGFVWVARQAGDMDLCRCRRTQERGRV